MVQVTNQTTTSQSGNNQVSTSGRESSRETFVSGGEARRSLMYPLDMFTDNKHNSFLVMRAMRINSSTGRQYFETRQAFTGNKPIGFDTMATINVYMPTLVENIQQTYDDAQHSLVGQFVSEASSAGVENAAQTAARGSGMIVGAAVRGVLGQFNDSYQQQQGRIVSPNIVGSYKGPSRRSQTLTFNFNPKSHAELKEVASIIVALHVGSLPRRFGAEAIDPLDSAIERVSSWANLNSAEFSEGVRQGLVVYEIPPIWLLEEVSDTEFVRLTPRFVFGPAGITNIRMNKTPEQYWKTFKGTAGDSASIEVEVTFTELFALDQGTYLNDMASSIKGYTGGN